MCAEPRDARLSNYRLERLLGAGGMAEVYLARDLLLDRDVAIKFISPDQAADPTARKRLLREARAAAALEHPNICGVHDVIVDPDGRTCIVMQYVEGQTLAKVLEAGPLDERMAFTVAADLASALAAAHKRGLIHRDLKPHNVMLTPGGRAKLLDFGLARQPTAPVSATTDTTATGLTGPALVMGTPAYMSPEQARLQPLDGRSDLFSLGAVLFECLTGRRPFHGATPLELAADVLHTDPPAVSSLRPSLTAQHDELVRRLLAKHPDDRFQSAEELLGALRVFTGASTGAALSGHQTTRAPRPRWWRARTSLVAAAAVVLVALAGFAAWRWRIPTEPPNDDAARWYRRGTEAIRDGSYHSGRLALNEAIKAAPEFAPAYIRMAEAEAELGEVESAQQALLRVDSLVPTKSRLPFSERKRIDAVRALMLRDVDRFVDAYEDLVDRHRDDPGAWLDLGRAQEAAEQSAAARASFEKALEIDGQYAAARLRRASILGLEGRREEALQEFEEAERLYRAASNPEGEVETLIRRAVFFNGLGELSEAREDLVRAEAVAGGIRSHAQQLRAQLTLSSVIASEGRWAEAEKIADGAVTAALEAHLEAVAADGLVDLAGVLFARGRLKEADGHLRRAIELAEKHGASRIAARASLQRAALMADDGRPREALTAASGPLEYFRANRYRRYELNALSVLARAHAALGNLLEARTLSQAALEKAKAIGNEAQIGEALENLGAQANALGLLPEALEYRRQSVDLHRRLNAQAALPYDLANGADLLIRLGRHDEAGRWLDELEAGAARKEAPFVARARRTRLLRGLSAAIEHRARDVVAHLENFPPAADGDKDATSQFADVLLRYADSVRGIVAGEPLLGGVSSAGAREARYWDLAARLRGQPGDALKGAEQTLEAAGPSAPKEFEWRVAAIAAAAARAVGDAEREARWRDRAARALGQLRTEWGAEAGAYEARADLVELRRRAGLNP